MAGKLHHVALPTAQFSQTVGFFRQVFSMTISKEAGVAPARQLWFHEGIQLNEVSYLSQGQGACDHVAIAVEDRAACIQRALSAGCTQIPGKPEHWLRMPEGICLELMEG